MTSSATTSRRQQILEALAQELETSPGDRITTARLAAVVGVSEAALYRHFASKAKMLEALIAFAEDSVFGLIARILAEQSDAAARCERILGILLGFSARNPGITRVLLGDALVGEHERLQARVGQFFSRVETQVKQVLRESEASTGTRWPAPVPALAGLMVAIAEGRMAQFARTRFLRSPLEGWEDQWRVLRAAIFGR
jgi:TetR/AcrR family transcriptional regulator